MADLTPEELAAEEQRKAQEADDAKAKKEQEAADKKAAKAAEATAKKEQKAAETAQKKAAKAQADAAKKAEREASKLQQNGIARPLTGMTKQVWDIADAISQTSKKPAERKDVIEQGKAAGLQEGTINTQYGRWRRFHGLTVAREAKPAAPTPEVPPSVPPAADGEQAAQ